MQCKRHGRLSIWLTLCFTLMNLAQPKCALAQDSGQATDKDKSSSQDSSKSSDSTVATPANPVSASWPDSYIRQIGTSGLLAGNRQGVGWGSLYIPSAGVSGIVDSFDATSTQPGAVFATVVLQTVVVYDHKLGSSRFAIQYEPNVAFVDGQVVSNFSNQNASLDILIYQRPRWSVRFSDSFRYAYTQQTLGYPYFDVNPTTSGTITNAFVDGPQRWISNSAALSAGYAMSMRSSITVTPGYTFSESGEGATLTKASSYGGNVNWNYRTSERQTVGVMYSGQLIQETSPAPPGTLTPVLTNTLYNTVAGTASRQLSAGWSVRGALGATITDLQNQRGWSFYGSFGLMKQLSRSTFGLSYTRGDTLSAGLISSYYADRIDLTYQYQMRRRLSWGTGGGYMRQVNAGGFSAWYASANLRFLLAPRAGLFSTVDYTHKNQIGDLSNLFEGNRDTVSFGIVWQPARVPR
jgi:hypothetical protein